MRFRPPRETCAAFLLSPVQKACSHLHRHAPLLGHAPTVTWMLQAIAEDGADLSHLTPYASHPVSVRNMQDERLRRFGRSPCLLRLLGRRRNFSGKGSKLSSRPQTGARSLTRRDATQACTGSATCDFSRPTDWRLNAPSELVEMAQICAILTVCESHQRWALVSSRVAERVHRPAH